MDAARKTTTGTFHVVAAGLESATLAPESGVTLGGTLTAEGAWAGSLRDPAVDVTLSGTNLMIERPGPMPIAATGGTFDGVLKGPITSLGGEGTLSIGSVTIGGRDAGAITADLTMSAGVVHVAARAPTVKTTLDVSIGVEAPNAFDGHGALADYDVEALLALTGMPVPDPGAIRGRISSSI